MHVAAVEHGNAPTIWDAMENKICDYSWKMDFGKLYQFAGGDQKDVGRAVLYGHDGRAQEGSLRVLPLHGGPKPVRKRLCP